MEMIRITMRFWKWCADYCGRRPGFNNTARQLQCAPKVKQQGASFESVFNVDIPITNIFIGCSDRQFRSAARMRSCFMTPGRLRLDLN
jgi:hypothetical protein